MAKYRDTFRLTRDGNEDDDDGNDVGGDDNVVRGTMVRRGGGTTIVTEVVVDDRSVMSGISSTRNHGSNNPVMGDGFPPAVVGVDRG